MIIQEFFSSTRTLFLSLLLLLKHAKFSFTEQFQIVYTYFFMLSFTEHEHSALIIIFDQNNFSSLFFSFLSAFFSFFSIRECQQYYHPIVIQRSHPRRRLLRTHRPVLILQSIQSTRRHLSRIYHLPFFHFVLLHHHFISPKSTIPILVQCNH